jgi:hypothetical protein
LAAMFFFKHSSTPPNLDWQREQLECSVHPVALNISHNPGVGAGTRVAGLIGTGAAEEAGGGGWPVQMKISAQGIQSQEIALTQQKRAAEHSYSPSPYGLIGSCSGST